MEELFSEIKKEYEEKDKQKKLSSESVEDKHKSSSDQSLAKVNEKEKNKERSSYLDGLLAEVKSEFEGEKESFTKNHGSKFDNLLSQVDQGSFSPRTPSYSVPKQMRFRAKNDVLAERKEEIKEQEQEEKVRQEDLLQQQLQERENEAKVWLEQLDVNSEEGLWFEEFAYAYPSNLAAA
ncbi:MAG: hypothetical protein WA999_21710, partial [Spirulinaceae cyanobacterium]